MAKMRLELTGRHIDITPTLRRLVDVKLAKLERLLNDSAVSAQAVLTREKYRRRTEITLHARGEKFLHAIGLAATWESSLTQATDKIAQQAQKVKGKWQERKRRGLRPSEAATEAGDDRGPIAATAGSASRPRMPRILRASRQTVTSMSVADAARKVDAQGDGLVIFRDLERATISVLYRAPDGGLTLVETEA
jgi:putative sigma-54 modulation protein